MLQHLKVIDGVEFIQVHPTFLYESLWNLLLLFCLLMLWKHRKYDGQIAACYLVGYGLGRIWIESLRTDQLLAAGNSDTGISGRFGDTDSVFCDLYDQEAQTTKRKLLLPHRERKEKDTNEQSGNTEKRN